MSEEVKTTFKGPGEWRSQAKRLEAEAEITPDEDEDENGTD